MADVTVKLDGVREFRRNMLTFNKGVIACTKRAINRAALRVERDAKRSAPVDTGRLQSSIRTVIFQGGFAATVTTNVDYASFVEFGTRFQVAQPFLLPAWDKVRPKYIADLKKCLKRRSKGK